MVNRRMPRGFDGKCDLGAYRRSLADPNCKTCNGFGELFPRPLQTRQRLGSSGASPSLVACACVERAEARETKQARREERIAEKLAESVAKKLAKSLPTNAQAPQEVRSVAQQPATATLLGPDGKPIPTREVQSLAQQLATLNELYQAGALTAAEFARAKTRLINGFV